MSDKTQSRMSLVPALQVLLDLRRDQIVVTTMGSAREWPKLSSHPLDFHYVPSAMGEAPALGLGLALAKPGRDVLVLNGDGGMLMNLGALVTIVASGAANITIVVLNNGIYEVTGGQRTAAACVPTNVQTDFAAMARAAGFASVSRFDTLKNWRRDAPQALRMPGPRFIELAVGPIGPNYHLEAPGPIVERVAHFQGALRDV
jgi:sulfopyruvate decarboxylase subunit beta